MRSLALALLLALPAVADDTIVVTGHGEALVRPDRVEFRFQVVAHAEKAADAVTKIGEKSQKVKDALVQAAAERKLPEPAVKEGGLEFLSPPGNDDGLGAMGGAEGSGEVMLERSLTMAVDGIDKMKDSDVAEHVAAIVDAAVAAGASYTGGMQWDWTGRGPVPATVVFRMSDPKAALAKALDAAAEDAKTKAADIAKRFGREVGAATKIEEIPAVAAAPEGQAVLPGRAGAHDSSFSGLGEARITADLQVEYKLK